MKKLLSVIALSLCLGGCAGVNAAIGVYDTVTTATVDPGTVAITANAFDGLKATAENYAGYCVSQHFPQPICSATNRRAVIKAVNAGTAARNQLESAINTSTPAVASVYNALVAAVNSLKASPISTVKGS